MDKARPLRRKIPQRPRRQEESLESTIRWGLLSAAAIATGGNLADDARGERDLAGLASRNAGKGRAAVQATDMPRIYTER